MRMSDWSPEIVRFMEDAASESEYFAKLAGLVTEGLHTGGRICDAGCGMGQLAAEMARLGYSVDAIDSSPAAIAAACGLVQREGLGGSVSAYEADYRTYRGNAPFDRMVFCLSASVSNAFAAACAVRAKSLVVVNKVHPRMEYKSECLVGRPILSDAHAEFFDLKTAGIVCSVCEIELEYGQPFRTLDDARRYFSLFRTRKYPLGATDRDLRHELEERRSEAFPWYLPVTRRLSIFEVDMEKSAQAMKRGEMGCVVQRGAGRLIA